MSDKSEQAQQQIRVTVAPEIESGVYANFLHVHSSPWDFILTFCQMLIPRREEETSVEARAVARVVIPAPLMDAVIAALQRSRNQREKLAETPKGEGGVDASGAGE